MLQVEGTKIDDVSLIQIDRFEDFRGSYMEIYNEELYQQFNIDFVQDDISRSRKDVLRGIHGDLKTWKLVSCLFGAFYLVIIDLREDSKSFKSWEAFTLSDTNNKQVLIPPGCGNGHLALTEEVIFHYKQSTYYDRESQFTRIWDDPDLGLWWPVENPILSQRDEAIYD